MNRKHAMHLLTVLLIFSVLAAGIAEGAKVKLQFLINNKVQGIENAAAEYMKTHPDVEIEFVYEAGLVDNPQHAYTAKALTMIAGGLAPDILWIAGHAVAQYSTMGILLPLDDYIKRSGVNKKDFIPPAWSQTEWGGHVYAMTMLVDANFALVRNKTLFAEAGLNPEQAPATLADYESAFKKLTKTDADGKLTQIGARPWDVYGGGNTVFTWSWIFGGDFFDYATNKVTAANPLNVQALEWVRDYYNRFQPISNTIGNFNNGKEGMRFMHSGNAVDSAKQVDIGVSLEPYKADTGRPNPSWIGGWAMSIAKVSKNPDVAWDFIRYISATAEGTNIVATGTGFMSAYLKAPNYYNEHAKSPIMRVYMEVAQNARYMRPSIPVAADYITALDQAFKDVVAAKSQPRDALQFVQEQIQNKLDAILKK